jgi:effector-binding domain-containing protein
MRPRALPLVLLLCACQATPVPGVATAPAPALPELPTDLPIAAPPYDQVAVDWKQRLDQPYVFLAGTGSYTGIGTLLEELFAGASAQRIEVTGPPFALYYDDPGHVPADQLRMRACLPVGAPATPAAPLGYEVLDSTTVVYAYVSGPYPDVPRAYPALFGFLRRLDWVAAGPVREVYLRNPADVADWSELVTEVQIPAAAAR